MAVNLLFEEIANRLNRRKCEVYFSDHAARDKNLDREDSENSIKTSDSIKIITVIKEKGKY